MRAPGQSAVDREGARAGGRRHRQVARAGVVIGGVAICLLVLALFVPLPLVPVRFDVVNATTHADPGTRTITERMLVRNGQPFSQHVASAEVSAPGTQTISANTPVTIPASGGSAWVEVVYRVTDCRVADEAQRDSPFPVHLRINEWYGLRSETVRDFGSDYPGPREACS